MCISETELKLFLRMLLIIDDESTGDDLEPSGNKLLLDPMLTQIFDTIWSYWVTVCLIVSAKSFFPIGTFM